MAIVKVDELKFGDFSSVGVEIVCLVSLVLLGFNLKDETGQVWWHAWEAKDVLGGDLCEFSSLIC